MPSSDDKRLSGMARSIDALFDDPSPRGGDVEWKAVEAGPSRADDADPQAFQAALEAFTSSPPLDRENTEKVVREQATALRDAGMLDPLADAVERLTLREADPPDEAHTAMARHLLTPGVASRIAARLGATREEERREELLSLCRIMGHEMALAVADALSDTTDRYARRSFVDAMVSMGPSAMDVVETMVEDGRWFVVRNAVAILGEAGGERAVELVTSSLAHPDARVRREALLSLARVGGEDAGMLVYGMLEDPDPDVRLAAVMAAGALKVERALKPLMALLEDESEPDVLVAVLHALGQLGDPGAVNGIEKRAVASFFSRPPNDVRIAGYRALLNIGTPRARKLLDEAAEDKDPEVRTVVRQMLRAKAAEKEAEAKEGAAEGDVDGAGPAPGQPLT